MFIITHGRPDAVHTLKSLLKAGYTGKYYLVIDDEDKTGPQYHAQYGDKVLTFSKNVIAETFDSGDNFPDHRSSAYARNACNGLAVDVGCRYFIVLDDDYTAFAIRCDSKGGYDWTPITTMDSVLSVMLDFYIATPSATLCMSQGGDHIGGAPSTNNKDIRLTRKAMNSWISSTDRPLNFFGRLNEDTTLYVTESRKGTLFFTAMMLQLNQKPTQATAGGMTAIYLEQGTYVKSFYSVMYAPSCVKVGVMGDSRTVKRIHHDIAWKHTAPMILRESHRKSTVRPEAVNV